MLDMGQLFSCDESIAIDEFYNVYLDERPLVLGPAIHAFARGDIKAATFPDRTLASL